MTKEILIKLRCKAWGITEDEYYCNQCSDFSLEDMARAYRRGKNKGFEKVKELEKELKYAEENCLFRDCPKVEKLEKENAELKDKADKCQHLADVRLEQELETYQKSYTVSREKLDTEIALDEVKDQLTKAKTYLKYFVNILKKLRASKEPLVIEAEQFLKDSEVENDRR